MIHDPVVLRKDAGTGPLKTPAWVDDDESVLQEPSSRTSVSGELTEPVRSSKGSGSQTTVASDEDEVGG